MRSPVRSDKRRVAAGVSIERIWADADSAMAENATPKKLEIKGLRVPSPTIIKLIIP